MLTAVTTASFSFRGKSKKKMENTKVKCYVRNEKTGNTPKNSNR